MRKVRNVLVGGSKWKVDRVQVQSSKLIELGPEWPGWKDGFEPFEAWEFTDAIVKVIPPATVPGSLVDQLERALYERGARTVRVMPQLPQDKVMTKPEERATLDTRSIRQVVQARAAAVQEPRDRDALVQLLNAAMDAGEAACT